MYCNIWPSESMCHLYPDFLTSYKIRKKVMEQLFKVSQPNVSLFVPVNCPPPLDREEAC